MENETNTVSDAIVSEVPRYFNELESWIKFNDRVVNEASRSINPIIERLNFIGIADSNLDEFIRTKFSKVNDINHKVIRKMIDEQTSKIEELYDNLICELRDKYSINITDVDSIRDNQKAYRSIKNEFYNNIYPTLQPLIMTEELPMPSLLDGASFIITKFNDDNNKTCIVRLPETKLIKVKGVDQYKQTYILIEDVIKEFIPVLYRKKEIDDTYLIRALRQIDSLNAGHENYLSYIKQQIKNRENATIQMIDYYGKYTGLKGLITNKESKRKRKYVQGLSFLKDIRNVISYDKDMVYPKTKPRTPVSFVGESMFETLSDKDVLVHFPYESFDMSTVRFLQEAADDPDVITIKQTLYRVGKNSPLIKALIKAAKNGKQVVVLLELKAKMDEQNNLELTEKLKDAGCNVIFGPIDIKTHAKVTLIVRNENSKAAKYINISTGNFNDKTAKIYEDVSYFVKERPKLKIGTDLTDLFNFLGGYSELSDVNDLLISPKSFRQKIEKEIDSCILSKTLYPDKPVSIHMKCNAFTDKRICEKLYEASNIGVDIKLIIRGMCILIPGVEGMSENIKVISIVGRYLEHSRIYEFSYYAENEKLIKHQFIGSGDMMPRNLDYRVEVIVPIRTAPIKNQISEIFNLYFADVTNSYTLVPTGDYILPNDNELTEESFSVQNNLIDYYKIREKTIVK